MATKTAHLNVDPDLKKALADIANDLTALRASIASVATDVGVLDTALDVLVAKLNLDAGVTDVNYAGALSAMTVAAPTLNTSEK